MNFSLFFAQSLMNDRNQRWSSNFSSSWVLSLPRGLWRHVLYKTLLNFLFLRVSRAEPWFTRSRALKAAGSVDSTLGRLRAIFNKLRRANDSNPVAHPLVKDYLKFIREEQAGLAITPFQKFRLFFGKFRQLIAHLRDLCSGSVSLSRAGKYALVRDATFFTVDFFTGDRASDLGGLQSCNVFRLKTGRVFCLDLPSLRICARDPPALSL